MFRLPRYIEQAFEALYYESTNDEKYEAFASQWKGVDGEAFRKAVHFGHGDDRVVALFALGSSHDPQGIEDVVPFLHSAERVERWAAALGLANGGDRRAIPFLQTMLTEGISTDASDETDEYAFWYGLNRGNVVALLAQWNEPSCIPFVRHAVVLLWQIEQTTKDHAFFDYRYYDALAHLLGSQGAFGALTGIPFSELHRKVALVYMALGALQIKLPFHDLSLSRLLQEREEQSHVADLLSFRFGLSEEEREDCIQHAFEYQEERNHAGEQFWQRNADADAWQEDAQEDAQKEQEFVQPTLLAKYSQYTSSSYNEVYALAWSPDGTLLLSAGEDARVQVWDAFTGAVRTTFAHHKAAVTIAVWSPQGDFIASGGGESAVYVWNAQTSEVVTIYTGHRSFLYRGLTWSPDGTRIASGSWDGTVQVWDAFSGEQLQVYRGHHGVVSSVAWSPDGQSIASGGGYPECLIQVWNVQTGATLLTYRGHTREGTGTFLLDGQEEPYGASSVHSLAWSPAGTYLASGGLRNIVQVWNATTGQEVVARRDQVRSPLAWFPDGSSLLSPQVGMHSLERWNARTGKVVTPYDAQWLLRVEALSISPDGKRVAVAGWRSVIAVWEV